MDVYLKKAAIAISIVSIIVVIAVVLLVNKNEIRERFLDNESTMALTETMDEKAENETVKDALQVGNDLYAWKNDETFFDVDEESQVSDRIKIEIDTRTFHKNKKSEMTENE